MTMMPNPVLSVSPRPCVRRSFAAWAAALLSLAAFGTPARAQIGIEDVLGSVTDIDVSASCWATKSPSLRGADCPGGRNGYGLEVLWELKTVHLGRRPRVDTTWVASQKTVTVRQGRADTVTSLTLKEEEEEILPHTRSMKAADAAQSEAEEAWEQFESNGTGDPIAEERRLFYVGITRARHRLTLSGCATRRRRDDVIPRQPSRFLKEVPPDLLEYRTGKRTSLSEEDSKELRSNFFSKMKEMLGAGG